MTISSQEPETGSTPGGLDFDPDRLREKYRQERDRRLRADGNEQYLSLIHI